MIDTYAFTINREITEQHLSQEFHICQNVLNEHADNLLNSLNAFSQERNLKA